jgi:hypothetical protein
MAVEVDNANAMAIECSNGMQNAVGRSNAH